MSTKHIHLILVPGTWATRVQRISDLIHCRAHDRKAIWANPNSSFSKELINALDKVGVKASVEDTQWTERNSFLSRSISKDEISNKIKDAKLNKRDIPICIIAHSHGGNAALISWATELRTNRKIQLITLATPFLNVREIHNKIAFIPSRLLFSFMYGILALLYSVLAIAAIVYIPSDDLIFPIGFAVKHYGVAYVTTVYVTALVGLIYVYHHGSMKLQSWFRSRREENTNYIKVFRNDDTHIPLSLKFLVLKIKGDEAFFIINLASFIARPFSALRRLIDAKSSKRFFWQSFLGAMIFVIGFIAYIAYDRQRQIFHNWNDGRQIFAFALAFSVTAVAVRAQLTIILLAVILALQSTGGVEMLIGNDVYAVDVDTRPDNFDVKEPPLDPDIHTSNLRHSVYLHPQCIGEIVDFLGKWLDARLDK